MKPTIVAFANAAAAPGDLDTLTHNAVVMVGALAITVLTVVFFLKAGAFYAKDRYDKIGIAGLMAGVLIFAINHFTGGLDFFGAVLTKVGTGA